MPRPDPSLTLPQDELSLDFDKAEFVWFKYRDPYNDGFFLSYLAADRHFRAFYYVKFGEHDGDTTIRYATDEQCNQLRAMLSPDQIAFCVNTSLRRVIGDHER
jgi:hypothetical protein